MLTLLAQRSDADVWLDQNPLILGLLFFAIGAALIGFGAYELSRGVAWGKWGTRFEGPLATVISSIRIVAGLALWGFAAYKVLF